MTKYSDNIESKHKDYVWWLNDDLKRKDELVKRTWERGQMELEDFRELLWQQLDRYWTLEKKYEEKYEKCQKQKTKIKHLKDKVQVA